MKCPSCGHENEGRFCNRCGAPIDTVEPGPVAQQDTPIAPAPVPTNAAGNVKQGKKKVSAGVGCLIVLGAIILFGVIGGLSKSDSGTAPVSSTPETKASVETPKPEPAKPNLEVLKTKWVNEDYVSYATGSIRNNTTRTYSYVQVSINLYDGSDAQVGSTMANTNNLEPGGVWKFKAVILQDSARSYKVMDVTGW